MVLAGHDIAFELSVSGDVEQPGPGLFPGMSLLRVFKESLTNVVKHSGAKKVAVLMEFEKNHFRMTVRDDGRGMPPEKGSGRGLKNMTNRIEELGGFVTCRNEQGTHLVFELPLPLKTNAMQG
jgi:signal transduction histidine kinase